LVRSTKYNAIDLRRCVIDLHALAVFVPDRHRAVRRKYAQEKFHGVAKLAYAHPFAANTAATSAPPV
jgi:hypothetical protein